MATELKERERDGKERERRRERDGRERDNDDSRSHRSHRSHREREDHDDDGPHRSRRDSHRSRDDADRDRRRHHSHSPPRERRHSTSSRRHDTEHEHESHSRESKRHSSSGDHKDDVKAPAYPPDFLRQYSPAGSIGGNDKFDVITGAEAVRFTKQFIRDQAAEGTTLPPALAAALPSTTPPSAPLPLIAKSPSATSHKSLTAHNALESRGSKRLHPVVFALPRSATNAAGGAGRKVVDFYMSWRGKTTGTLGRDSRVRISCVCGVVRGAYLRGRTRDARRMLIPPTHTPVLPVLPRSPSTFSVLDLGPALAAGRAYHLFLLLFLGYRPRPRSTRRVGAFSLRACAPAASIQSDPSLLRPLFLFLFLLGGRGVFFFLSNHEMEMGALGCLGARRFPPMFAPRDGERFLRSMRLDGLPRTLFASSLRLRIRIPSSPLAVFYRGLAAGRGRYYLILFLGYGASNACTAPRRQNPPPQRPLAARQLSRHGVSTGEGDAGWGVEEGEGRWGAGFLGREGGGRCRAREMGRAQRRRLQQSCAGNGLRADVVDTWGGERWTLSSAGDGCCGRDAAASARGQRPARGQGARTQSIRGEGGDGQCRAQEIGRRGGVPSSAPAGREVIVDTRGGALSRRPRALEAAVRRPSLALPSFFTLHLYLYLSLLTNRTLGVVYGSSPGEAQHRFFSYS
ncbi:hypothetical protein C8F04DRAFT_1233255 [Mycena alexandri]|uniref:Uncharacterized protein n=1 Tax=Mycena alexandri TaxID=1745969 RepID=A0AAD6SXX6_9AGAR|nr:hypothetical protein C8F04DRAFT_1233255 [Mycena alexandri]